MFDILKDNGFNVAGFHIFKGTGPGFILPDLGQGWEQEMKDWPNPIPSHRNYVTPVARLKNHLQASPTKPHAIFIHIFAQAVPAVLEVLAEHASAAPHVDTGIAWPTRARNDRIATR